MPAPQFFYRLDAFWWPTNSVKAKAISHLEELLTFWATICKTVRHMLSGRCLSVLSRLSVCDVGVLWPNGWMDQDETCHAGRPRPWSHCVGWRPSSPSPKGHSPLQCLAHICCGQMAGWIKMPLGMEVDLSPGDFVLDGEPASPKIFGPCLL